MQESIEYDALQDYVVLSKVFQHLEATDLLQCRLVCKNWLQFSKSEFLSNALLHFSDKSLRRKNEISDIPKTFTNFYHTFPTSANTHQFRRVALKGTFDANEVETFFHSRSFIKEIILTEVNLTRDGEDLEDYDIGLLLTGLNLRKLVIWNNFWSISFRKVQLPIYPSIKIIWLKCCALVHTPNQCIAPEELHLYGDNSNMLQMLIKPTDQGNGTLQFNDFVDVKKLKTLHLDMLGPREVNLDLTEAVKLEQLHLAMNTNLTGIRNNRSLKRLNIFQYVIEEPIYVRLNLSDLPSSLEDLRLNYGDFYNFLSYTMDHDLPQIKSLELTQATLPLLKRCTHLTDFKFNSDFGSKLRLKYFPSNLKNLKLHDNCDVVGSPLGKIELDKLVIVDMDSNTFTSTYKLIDMCEPRVVVLKPKPTVWCLMEVCGTCSRKVDPYYPIIEYQVKRGGECVIGGVYTIFQKFCDCNGRITPATTYFNNYDENGEYIRFSKDYQEDITKQEFETLMKDTK